MLGSVHRACEVSGVPRSNTQPMTETVGEYPQCPCLLVGTALKRALHYPSEHPDRTTPQLPTVGTGLITPPLLFLSFPSSLSYYFAGVLLGHHSITTLNLCLRVCFWG